MPQIGGETLSPLFFYNSRISQFPEELFAERGRTLAFAEEPVKVGDAQKRNKHIYLPRGDGFKPRPDALKIDFVHEALNEFLPFAGEFVGRFATLQGVEVVLWDVHIMILIYEGY